MINKTVLESIYQIQVYHIVVLVFLVVGAITVTTFIRKMVRFFKLGMTYLSSLDKNINHCDTDKDPVYKGKMLRQLTKDIHILLQAQEKSLTTVKKEVKLLALENKKQNKSLKKLSLK